MIFNSGIRTIFSWYKISEDMNLKTTKLIILMSTNKHKNKIKNSAKYFVKKLQSKNTESKINFWITYLHSFKSLRSVH